MAELSGHEVRDIERDAALEARLEEERLDEECRRSRSGSDPRAAGQNGHALARSSFHLPAPPSSSEDEVESKLRGDNSQTPNDKEIKQRRFRDTALWKFEVLAIVTSAAAMVSIAAVLAAFDGKSTNTWHAFLRPNTAISALATLSNSSMLMVIGECIGQLKWVYFQQRAHRLMDFELFDGASRGPLGSAKLISLIGWRAMVAAIGALLTILALGVNPFVQQVVSYEPDFTELPDSAEARLPYTRIFNSSGQLPALVDSTMESNLLEESFQSGNLVRSAYRGVLGADNRVSHTCTSGNCTWPVFETLGICSMCHVGPPTTDLELDPAWLSPGYGEGVEIEGSIHDYSTRNDMGVQMYSVCSPTVERSLFNSTSFATPFPMGGFGNWPRYAPMSNGSLVDIAAFRFPLPANDYDCAMGSPTAYDCELYWCAKTYETSRVENGDLIDVPARSEPIILWQNFEGDLISAFKESDVDQFTLIDESGPALEYTGPPDNDKAFWLNKYAVDRAGYGMESLFRQALDTMNMSTYAGLAQELYSAHNGDFVRTVETVAESMTNQIRMSQNSSDKLGELLVIETYIRVSWPWMALPASLVLLSAMFLITSMRFAAEKSQVVWKNHSLAPLFHGLSGWDAEALQATKLPDIERCAKEMRACLRHDGENLRLLKE